jgi:hypothetical protein
LMFSPNTGFVNLGSSTNSSIVFIYCFFIMLGVLIKCCILSKHFMNPQCCDSFDNQELKFSILTSTHS